MPFDRHLGLEQEFFVVDREGHPTHSVDELLDACRREALAAGIDGACFGPEWVKNIIEISTPPCSSLERLAEAYFAVLQLTTRIVAALELRLYPLAVFPTHLMPTIRDELNYQVQVRTVGHERFLNAGRCTGTHLHLEVPPETIDRRVGVSYRCEDDAREELLNVYNFATALDPALIALGRACPYFEGVASGLARRTACYRGSKEFGWDGVYTNLPEVGALRPYAHDVEHLVQLQFERHYRWLAAMDQADVERDLYLGDNHGLLDSSWNPVRLNVHGTVELRNMDSNLPSVILSMVQLVSRAHRRVIEEQLQVVPRAGTRTLQWSRTQLVVPDFEFLSTELLFAAATEGLRSSIVWEYAQSLIHFAYESAPSPRHWVEGFRPQLSEAHGYDFDTTESHLLERFPPSAEHLTPDEGLEIVRYACDLLESQLEQFDHWIRTETLEAS
jgi:gamma-glutamyl:cysteine ligase YbdK (ATP-grasp superfamily)